jgi:hypothetical protein
VSYARGKFQSVACVFGRWIDALLVRVDVRLELFVTELSVSQRPRHSMHP